jgi:hypothetical protein
MFEATKMTPDKKFSLRKDFVGLEFNTLYKKMCVEARLNHSLYPITTVKGQSTYSIPTDVCDIHYLFYESALDIWRVKKIDSPSELIYAKNIESTYDPSYYDVDMEAHTITLYPAPKLDGEVTSLFIQRVPSDLTKEAPTFTLLPANFDTDICDLVISRLSIMCGHFEEKYTNAAALGEKLAVRIDGVINKLRKQVNFRADAPGQIKEKYWLSLLKFNQPVVSHSPIVNRVQYMSALEFANFSTGYLGMKVISDSFTVYNDATGVERFKVDATGAYVNGVKLAFLGYMGTSTLSGTPGLAKTVTIPDQGAVGNYEVICFPYGDGTVNGNVGEITANKISGTQFEAFAQGATTATFLYLVLVS